MTVGSSLLFQLSIHYFCFLFLVSSFSSLILITQLFCLLIYYWHVNALRNVLRNVVTITWKPATQRVVINSTIVQ